MKNSIHLRLSQELTLQQKIFNLLMNVVDNDEDESTTDGNDGSTEDTEKTDRPKVTKVPPKIKKYDNVPQYNPEIDGSDRPKVTKVKAKRKRTPNQDEPIYYDYTFDFDIDMNDNHGMLTIVLTYEEKTLNFNFENVASGTTKLSAERNNTTALFGDLSSGDYEVTTFSYIDLSSPVLPDAPEENIMEFMVEEPIEEKLTLIQRVGRFFTRLFK